MNTNADIFKGGKPQTLSPGTLVLLMVLLPFTSLFASEGFGFRQKTVKIPQSNPEPALSVRVNSVVVKSPDDAAFETILGSAVEPLRVNSGSQRPDSILPDVPVRLTFTVKALDFQGEVQTIIVNQRKQTGSQRVCRVGPDGREYCELEPVYSVIPVEIAGERVAATTTVNLAIMEPATDRILASSELRERGTFASRGEARKRLAARIVQRSRDLFATGERAVSLPLPRGRFDPEAHLAQKAHWDLYKQALESMPPSEDPEAESYRQYGLALTMEALGGKVPGQTADELQVVIGYLTLAARNHSAAARLNPDQRLFAEQAERVQRSKARFEYLKSLHTMNRAVLAVSAPGN